MPKTSQLDVIMQQLDELSLAELLAVRVRVNALIENHSSPFHKMKSPIDGVHKVVMIQKFASLGSYGGFIAIPSENRDVDYLSVLPSPKPRTITVSSNILARLGELKQNKTDALVESESNPGNSLEKLTELVNELMSDESDYDEETYPKIEAALNQNQLSL